MAAHFVTLISGERDAVLVDTPITVEQARTLANWVCGEQKESDDDLRHACHGDHFFGTNTVLERFPVPALSRGRR